LIRLAMTVEGRTEEEFVNQVLAPYLRTKGVEAKPLPIDGNVTVAKVASDMAKLYWSFDFVTSLVDFYGFKDKGKLTPCELEGEIDRAIDMEIGRSWDQSTVFSYVQQHEFEGLLFSDISVFARVVGAPNGLEETLQSIRSGFPTPEDINDSSVTAPSKRIMKLMPSYNKVVHGPLLASDIGLTVIRDQCRRFDVWVTRMESL
jgi:hypothetical protein